MKLCRPAIITKFVGPTDFRGSRITCRALSHRLTVAWDHAIRHLASAEHLSAVVEFRRECSRGRIVDTGYAYIIRPRAVR